MSTDFSKKYRKIISSVNFLWKQPAVFKANPGLHMAFAVRQKNRILVQKKYTEKQMVECMNAKSL